MTGLQAQMSYFCRKKGRWDQKGLAVRFSAFLLSTINYDAKKLKKMDKDAPDIYLFLTYMGKIEGDGNGYAEYC